MSAEVPPACTQTQHSLSVMLFTERLLSSLWRYCSATSCSIWLKHFARTFFFLPPPLVCVDPAVIMVLHEYYSVSMSHFLICKPYNFCTLKWRRRINKSELAFLSLYRGRPLWLSRSQYLKTRCLFTPC